MKRLSLAVTALAFLAGTPLAFAQQDQHDQHSQQGQHMQDNHMAGPDQHGQFDQHDQHDQHMGPPGGGHMAPDHPQYSNNRPPEQNYGGGHQWHDGDHYNGSRHEVDWRQHHLRQPPHGYEWVQNGNNYVLIAVASGVIASIIANAMNQ